MRALAAKAMDQTAWAVSADGVPGFPEAKCVSRADWGPAKGNTFTATVRQTLWRFMCVGTADPHAFTVVGDDMASAQQALSAEYRMLAGK